MNSIDLRKKLYFNTPIILNIFYLIIFSICISWIFVWYFEKLNPGQYGIPSSWNFPFSIQYWIQHFNLNQMNLFQKKYSDETFRSSSSSSSSSKDKFDENNLIVEIDSLYKS
ncbi:unnamed protein product, partial [Adineta steineri]